MYGLLQFFTDIYITRAKQNVKTLQVVLHYFSYDDELASSFLDDAAASYLHLKPSSSEHFMLDENMMDTRPRANPNDKALQRKRAKFMDSLRTFPPDQLALSMSIFDFAFGDGRGDNRSEIMPRQKREEAF